MDLQGQRIGAVSFSGDEFVAIPEYHHVAVGMTIRDGSLVLGIRRSK